MWATQACGAIGGHQGARPSHAGATLPAGAAMPSRAAGAIAQSTTARTSLAARAPRTPVTPRTTRATRTSLTTIPSMTPPLRCQH